jgi:hypothetical protein
MNKNHVAEKHVVNFPHSSQFEYEPFKIKCIMYTELMLRLQNPSEKYIKRNYMASVHYSL